MGFKTDWQVGNNTKPIIKEVGAEYIFNIQNLLGPGNKFFKAKMNVENVTLLYQILFEIDGKSFPAGMSFSDKTVYEANVNVVFPNMNSSSALPGTVPSKDYKLVAKIIDFQTKTVVDSKTVIVNVDESGNIMVNGKKMSNNKNDNNTSNKCDCGEYTNYFKCTKYHKVYGPIYKGTQAMVAYNWDLLKSAGKINENEKEILIAISENEGNFDAVQSYDSEIITLGAMQKTMNIEGTGELPTQLNEFKISNPSKFKELFENCGWSIKIVKGKASLEYKDLDTSVSYGKTSLKKKIRENCSASKYGKIVSNKILAPFIKAGKDEEFQGKQVLDFISRLNSVLKEVPDGYKFKISDYIKSNFSKAVVLDHSVNRPGHVTKYLGEALKRFYVKYPNAPESPYLWGVEQQKYENWIIECYGPLRGITLAGVKSPMTDAVKRFEKIQEKFT